MPHQICDDLPARRAIVEVMEQGSSILFGDMAACQGDQVFVVWTIQNGFLYNSLA